MNNIFLFIFFYFIFTSPDTVRSPLSSAVGPVGTELQ